MEQESKRSIKKPMRYVAWIMCAVLFAALLASLWKCSQTTDSERHVRYVGLMNLASEKLAKTIQAMEMNAMNEFDEVEKHLDRVCDCCLGEQDQPESRGERLFCGL